MALFMLRDPTQPGTVTLRDGTKIVVAPGQAFTVPDSAVSDLDGNANFSWVQPNPSGTTAQRPTGALPVGTMYLDATLAKPIWWNGSVWKDATGATV